MASQSHKRRRTILKVLGGAAAGAGLALFGKKLFGGMIKNGEESYGEGTGGPPSAPPVSVPAFDPATENGLAPASGMDQKTLLLIGGAVLAYVLLAKR